jgi:hypothetical protein
VQVSKKKNMKLKVDCGCTFLNWKRQNKIGLNALKKRNQGLPFCFYDNGHRYAENWARQK